VLQYVICNTHELTKQNPYKCTVRDNPGTMIYSHHLLSQREASMILDTMVLRAILEYVKPRHMMTYALSFLLSGCLFRLLRRLFTPSPPTYVASFTKGVDTQDIDRNHDPADSPHGYNSNDESNMSTEESTDANQVEYRPNTRSSSHMEQANGDAVREPRQTNDRRVHFDAVYQHHQRPDDFPIHHNASNDDHHSSYVHHRVKSSPIRNGSNIRTRSESQMHKRTSQFKPAVNAITDQEKDYHDMVQGLRRRA
jgi:hypothetical protein